MDILSAPKLLAMVYINAPRGDAVESGHRYIRPIESAVKNDASRHRTGEQIQHCERKRCRAREKTGPTELLSEHDNDKEGTHDLSAPKSFLRVLLVVPKICLRSTHTGRNDIFSTCRILVVKFATTSC